MTFPKAIQPFVEFPSVLRNHGFAVSPDQTIGFIEAVGLLGPRTIDDIYRSGLAMLSIPQERAAEYDALFRAFFVGQTVSAAAVSSDEDEEVDAYEPESGEREVDAEDGVDEAGVEAVPAERLSQRAFEPLSENAALTRFSRLAPYRLPRRQSYRYTPARRGRTPDMRRTLREAVRRDGEVFVLPRLKRKTRQRRIVLLIDVSGSMSERTEGLMRFAHTLTQAADRVEAFTLGTRLTRVTPALVLRDPEQALSRVGQVVADFDGGTRIGEALQAFLAVPRFAGFTRGAAVFVLSDGLERGSADAMIDAVWRLSRLSWRLDWLTPLAAEEGYAPETEALSAILPYLDDLANGSDVAAVCDHILNLARAA